jgi:hypothetical protein
MDRLISAFIVVASPDRRNSDPSSTLGRLPMATARDTRPGRQSAQLQHVCDAIGRELRASYLPVSREPIPAELNELLTLVAALETQTNRNKRGQRLQPADDPAKLPLQA